MKTLTVIACFCSAALWASVQAETVHGKKAVDLDAAAKATAALYAGMALPSSTPVAPVSPSLTKAMPTPEPKAIAPNTRPSPLLPVVAAIPVVTAPPPTGEVWQGAYQCAHAEKVHLRPDALADHVELQWKAQRWALHRTDSRSGAMRLEDASGRMVWIQLGNKSMLLDQRLGKRLLDECQHAVQVQTAAQMKNNPPPALFDTTGMGR